jgi:hypothetical protein
LELRPFAWAVEAPDGWVSLYRDQTRALEFAARCHGLLIPLFDLRNTDVPSTEDVGTKGE